MMRFNRFSYQETYINLTYLFSLLHSNFKPHNVYKMCGLDMGIKGILKLTRRGIINGSIVMKFKRQTNSDFSPFHKRIQNVFFVGSKKKKPRKHFITTGRGYNNLTHHKIIIF